jgi:MFS family permease
MQQPSANSPFFTHRRVLAASLIGTAVEFYDFYIYATAASLVFGPLFFPSDSASAQLLAAYASLGIAFVARPVGAMAFGHFGDRIGRKSTLVASLLLMGGSTLAIAFLPTYADAGALAPILLCLLRFGQGFGLGGEWGGAALLAVENAPPGYHARFGMFPQLGAPVGFIAANGLFLILGLYLTPNDFQSWGWRLPFLASALLVGVGLWVRLRLAETPAFAAMLEKGPPPRVPVSELLSKHMASTIGGTIGAIVCFATYYVSTAFALGYGTRIMGYPRDAFLSVQLTASLAMAGGIILAGMWSDRFSARFVLLIGCIATIATGACLNPLMGSGSLTLVGIYLALSLFVMGFVYGPLGAWLPSLFPARVRYTGTSVTFNMAGVFGGGVAPIIAQTLAEWGGLGLVGLYLAGTAILSLVGILLLKQAPDAGQEVGQVIGDQTR